MSDLYFISSLQRAKGGSIFEKNGLLMIPSVSRFYTVDDSSKKAYIYYEINGMDFNENAIPYYDTRFFVYTFSGEEVASGSKEFIPKKSSETARVEVVPLGDLKTGMYRLSVLVTDQSTKRTVTRERCFRISSEEDRAMILPMSDADIENYLKQIQYIATNEEKKLFKRLNARGKQAFLLDFWRSRDSSPETPENEFMLAHFQKLHYAETHFKGGIDSDMGRVYIQYGPPMDVQREVSHIEYEKPVEIWTYAQDGRIEFIFVDRSGDNRFVLVHSTHVDEYSNPNWMDDLID
jgi:GWxTD domain-containing protein